MSCSQHLLGSWCVVASRSFVWFAHWLTLPEVFQWPFGGVYFAHVCFSFFIGFVVRLLMYVQTLGLMHVNYASALNWILPRTDQRVIPLILDPGATPDLVAGSVTWLFLSPNSVRSEQWPVKIMSVHDKSCDMRDILLTDDITAARWKTSKSLRSSFE